MPGTQPGDPRVQDDYPRPSLAVDVTVLTVERTGGEPGLRLLVIRRATEAHKGDWDIPGGFLRERERLAEAADRVLLEKAGVKGLEPRQLGVLDDPQRDDRFWVVAVAYTVAVPHSRLKPSLGRDVKLVPLQVQHSTEPSDGPVVSIAMPDGQGGLPWDHDQIVRRAVADLQQRYRRSPDPDRLLESDKFTLAELYAVHGIITPGEEQRDTFRRRVTPHMTEIGVYNRGVGRPAKLYRLPPL